MKTLGILVGAGVLALGSIGFAQAQPSPNSGTPGSAFPNAAPHEVMIVNGMPCRTVLAPNGNYRIPVECAEPITTGSIGVAPGGVAGPRAVVVPGPAGPAFPYAAPHEMRTVNGVPCRTILEQSSDQRIIAACAQ